VSHDVSDDDDDDEVMNTGGVGYIPLSSLQVRWLERGSGNYIILIVIIIIMPILFQSKNIRCLLGMYHKTGRTREMFNLHPPVNASRIALP